MDVLIGQLFTGLSLGSILLLAALGLSLMGLGVAGNGCADHGSGAIPVGAETLTTGRGEDVISVCYGNRPASNRAAPFALAPRCAYSVTRP